MLIRTTVFRTASTAVLLAATLAGCGAMRPSEKIDIYEATMTGSQEVPPVTTAGSGMAEVQLNTQTNKLSWKVTYNGMSGPAVAGHIHGPAAPGQNAGVLVPFTNVAAQPVTGETTVTPQQIADLMAGRWYVNVHTRAHPGGEIRGQLNRRQ